jgi:hypothetical protein
MEGTRIFWEDSGSREKLESDCFGPMGIKLESIQALKREILDKRIQRSI